MRIGERIVFYAEIALADFDPQPKLILTLALWPERRGLLVPSWFWSSETWVRRSLAKF